MRKANARARARLAAEVRRTLGAMGYEEVETPCLVPAPGMEPHIQAFEAEFVPEGGGARTPLFLHTSPEYAMKRLLAAGLPRVFQLARVFRNGEVSPTHNPEFTMLELYRAGTDYRGIMDDLERLVEACARALAPDGVPRAVARRRRARPRRAVRAAHRRRRVPAPRRDRPRRLRERRRRASRRPRAGPATIRARRASRSTTSSSA